MPCFFLLLCEHYVNIVLYTKLLPSLLKLINNILIEIASITNNIHLEQQNSSKLVNSNDQSNQCLKRNIFAPPFKNFTNTMYYI